MAVIRRLLCPLTNELLDKGMAVWFPGNPSHDAPPNQLHNDPS